jgi:S-DNA-T family DNA segregation ATPase FtsK/SpoIIIE
MSKKQESNKSHKSTVPIEIRGLALLFGCFLTLLSLISFKSDAYEDNWLGLTGYLIAFSLQYCFGIASFLLLIFFGWTALRLLRHKVISHYSLRCLYFFIMLASSCILLNLIAEIFPTFAAFFKRITYNQTLTLHTTLTYQKVRYNLGGAPFYYLYKDIHFFNLHRILSSIGISIVFSITFLVSFLQLTKWRLAFFIYGLFKNIFNSQENNTDEQKMPKKKSSIFSFFKISSEKKGFLDTIITIPSKPIEKTQVEPSPLKRKAELGVLPESFRKLNSIKNERILFADENTAQEIKSMPIKMPKKIPAEFTVSSKLSSSMSLMHPHFSLPNLSLLTDVKRNDSSLLKKDLAKQAEVLEETLQSFGIEAKVGQIYCGPTITSFEIQPAVGVKVQKIKTLENDIALNMQAKAIRIIAPIPGKACVGVEIPSPKPQEVSFKELISNYLQNDKHLKIPILLGKTVTGEDVISDLTKMPHCIIAGATGSGKSVCINTVVMSILMTAKPDEIKLLMVDPKKVELTAYNELPHLIAPVITDAAAASAALNWLVKEMERRYEMLKQVGSRNIVSFNERIKSQEEPEDMPEKLPYIVGIIDELADLMMVASQDIETPIARIAQMARAVGIHLILATQRPSREVITGLIKANFPTRIAFKVASRVNSQIILDDTGAESLLGNGDMLFLPPGTSTLIRTQGAFIRDEDINKVIKAICQQAPTNYLIKSFEAPEMQEKSGKDEATLDTLYGQAMSIVQETGTASTTFLQRKLKIGYARAASLVDQLESNGIIGPQEGAKPRKVLVFKELGAPKRNLPPPSDEDFEL